MNTQLDGSNNGAIASLFVEDRTGKKTPVDYDVRLTELIKYLKEERAEAENATIRVQGDSKLHWEGMIQVMDACRRAGFENVGFMQPPDYNLTNRECRRNRRLRDARRRTLGGESKHGVEPPPPASRSEPIREPSPFFPRPNLDTSKDGSMSARTLQHLRKVGHGNVFLGALLALAVTTSCVAAEPPLFNPTPGSSLQFAVLAVGLGADPATAPLSAASLPAANDILPCNNARTQTVLGSATLVLNGRHTPPPPVDRIPSPCCKAVTNSVAGRW